MTSLWAFNYISIYAYSLRVSWSKKFNAPPCNYCNIQMITIKDFHANHIHALSHCLHIINTYITFITLDDRHYIFLNKTTLGIVVSIKYRVDMIKNRYTHSIIWIFKKLSHENIEINSSIRFCRAKVTSKYIETRKKF